MIALIDSGFLYAVLDENDNNHQRVKGVLPELLEENETIVLPTVVIVEVAYLLRRGSKRSKKLGHKNMRQFISTLEESPLQLEPITKSDTRRIYELLEKYSDVNLDFVDASITALAERLDIRRILTVDQRDFRIIRPRHCRYFDIIP